MRAVILEQNGGPEVLKVSQIPVPEPGPGQIQVRVAYAAVHPIDIHSRSGAMKWNVPPLPFTMGYSYCGRVTKTGEGVDPGMVGKRVTASSTKGGYADYTVIDAKSVNEIAPNLSWQIGGFFAGSATTAWQMVHTLARVRAGDWVVVHSAAGPVGAMLVQIAKDAGAHVIGLVGGEKKIAYAKQFGADHLIDYVADKEWPKKVMEITNKRGVDFIMDGNLGPDFVKEFGCLAPLGQIIAIGAMAGPAPQVNISQLIGGSHGVRGFVVGHGVAKTKGAERQTLVDNIGSGKWKFPVSGPMKLEDVAEAHRLFESRATTGRFLLEVGGEI